MRYLGLDLGSKTLGMALSDPNGIIASSYKIIRHDEDYEKLVDEVDEGDAIGVPVAEEK